LPIPCSTTDRQRRTTRYEYDVLNRLVKTIAADGTSTSSTYDLAGRIESTTDANGKSTTNGYDSLGCLIRSSEILAVLNHKGRCNMTSNGIEFVSISSEVFGF
jgi:YD repeat-containing protein